TVEKGTERLRITPTPFHDDRLIDGLAQALVDVWRRLDLPLEVPRPRGGVSPSRSAKSEEARWQSAARHERCGARCPELSQAHAKFGNFDRTRHRKPTYLWSSEIGPAVARSDPRQTISAREEKP